MKFYLYKKIVKSKVSKIGPLPSKPLNQADINEKLRKAQEVAQRIGAQREIEQKMQRKLKENLHGVNQRVRQAEEHLRTQHDGTAIKIINSLMISILSLTCNEAVCSINQSRNSTASPIRCSR